MTKPYITMTIAHMEKERNANIKYTSYLFLSNGNIFLYPVIFIYSFWRTNSYSSYISIGINFQRYGFI